MSLVTDYVQQDTTGYDEVDITSTPECLYVIYFGVPQTVEGRTITLSV